MLTADEVRAMARGLESDRVERKRVVDRHTRARMRETVCAFANDMPGHAQAGYILVGVEDDGGWANLAITDELLCNLAGLRDNGRILPLPMIDVYKVEVEAGIAVAVVEVKPHPHPPVRLDGRTWIRVGPRLALATMDDERILMERRQKSPSAWDLWLCSGAAVTDLRMQEIRQDYVPRRIADDVLDALDTPRWTDVDILDTLRLWYRGIEKDGPTHGSMLLFAHRPRHFYSGLWLQFVRFDGTDRTDKVIDDHEYAGSVFDQLGALDKVEQHIEMVTRPDGQKVPSYPVAAVREAVINAVMHQDFESLSPILFYWYSDRIEVLNAGGLMSGVSPEIFERHGPPPGFRGRRTAYRNEAISEAMKAYEYVNKFGTGIPKIRQGMFANGNPYPEYSWDERGFGIRLYSAAVPRWETREQKVAWLATRPGNEEMAPLIAEVARDAEQRGLETGLLQGRTEESMRARRASLYAIFEARGLRPSDADRERIESCDDVEQLTAWIRRAATAHSPDDVLDS